MAGWWFQIFFMFLPIPGEMIQLDEHIFQMGWSCQLVFNCHLFIYLVILGIVDSPENSQGLEFAELRGKVDKKQQQPHTRFGLPSFSLLGDCAEEL